MGKDLTEDVVSKPVKKKKSGGCLTAFLITFLILILISCSISFLGFFLLISQTSDTEILKDGGESQIALIHIDGVISSSNSTSLFSSATGANDSQIVNLLDRAMNDDNIDAVLLQIESPGGEVAASDIISKKILEVRQQKSVVAYSSTMAASGGYMVAASADKFVVHPSAFTGSIGVILQTSNMEGLYEKLGIEMKTFKSGQFKDDSDLYSENSTGELSDIYQGLVDEAFEAFLQSIIIGRDMDRTLLEELADGRIYSGKQAVQNGLADSEGYFEDAVNITETIANIDNATVVEYSESDIWVGLFGNSTLKQLLGLGDIEAPLLGIYYLPQLNR